MGTGCAMSLRDCISQTGLNGLKGRTYESYTVGMSKCIVVPGAVDNFKRTGFGVGSDHVPKDT